MDLSLTTLVADDKTRLSNLTMSRAASTAPKLHPSPGISGGPARDGGLEARCGRHRCLVGAEARYTAVV